jgi:hypothetical protein
MAYVAPTAPGENRKHFKHRVQNVLVRIDKNTNMPTEMRIVRKFPGTNWKRVWINLRASAVPGTIKSTWYLAIHDIIPTNDNWQRCKYLRLLVLRADRLPDTSDNGMRWRAQNFDQDKTTPGLYTSYWSQTRPTAMDPSPWFPSLAGIETNSRPLDHGPPSTLPSTSTPPSLLAGLWISSGGPDGNSISSHDGPGLRATIWRS